MSSDTIQLDIITHDGKQFSESVGFFKLFTADGEVGVYPDHTTMVSTVTNTAVLYQQGESEDYEGFYISEGTIKVQDNIATVLTTEYLTSDSINQEAEQTLEKQHSDAYKKATTYEEQEKNRAQILKSQAKLRVLAKK